jgi:glutamate--cysteine ligase
MPWCSPPAEPPPIPARGAARLLPAVRAAFGAGAPARPRRIGAEAELIPLLADSGAPVPIHAPQGISSLAVLREHAARAGWVERSGTHGDPLFLPPQGGAITFEPGGQIEYSSAPCRSVGELAAAMRAVILPLQRSAGECGVRLLSVGIDPLNPLEAVPQQLHAPRYRCMAEYFARLGPAGARMMRQTASFQVNLDWEGEFSERWGVLNAAAPYLTAMFAHSSWYGGAPTGERSSRARAWRELDPGRTGTPAPGPDPVESYLQFALGARTILKRNAGGEPLPFGAWVSCGEATDDDWRTHLSTLFPEVRPKGFAEVRSLDAVAPEWFSAPLALLAGLVYHPTARAAAADLLGPADPARLRRAGEAGLRDALLASRARDLAEIGARGAAGLPGFVDGASLEELHAFLDHYTRRGRAPADDVDDGLSG